ncbi:MAG: alpha/beta hydrolase fold family protein [Noviherbaspirillum sp.]|nr:alpha/beta hydrolase fold family protein [Noviherbaspirillum sp.]
MRSIWNDLLGCQVRYYGKKYKTRVIEGGDGPPLIMLHGVGGHAEAYSRNLKRLSKDFHVLAIDFLWHGLSAKPAFDGAAVPAYVEQIIDLMDSLGYEKAAIEGESLGGWVALYMALNRPERMTKMILNTNAGIVFNKETTDAGIVKIQTAEGTDLLRERSLKAIENPTLETCRKRLEWLMASPDRVTDELVELRYQIYSDPETKVSLKAVFEHTFNRDTSAQFRIPENKLAEVTVPTLVLWSDKNPGTGPDVGKHIASRIPGAEYYCINDAAHWPQWEKPEEHDRVVAEFLRK